MERSEKAHIRYPLLHFGPTPSSVRSELAQAQAKRGLNSAQSRPRPMKPVSQTHPPPLRPNATATAATSNNPFAEHPVSAPAPVASQPLPQGLAIENQHAPSVMQPPLADATHERSWDTPDAPLPPGLRSEASDTNAQFGGGRNVKTQFEVEEPSAPAPTHVAHANNKKAQALELLRQARQALAAGNIDEAQAAAQKAGASVYPSRCSFPVKTNLRFSLGTSNKRLRKGSRRPFRPQIIRPLPPLSR